MPTYAYVCQSCHHEFDAFQGIKAKSLRECPACGQRTLRRLIGSGAAIIFKGSGFYCTDYRSDGYKSAAKSEAGGAKAKTGEKKETKTESTTTPSAEKSESRPAEKIKSA
ncbi:MAG: zinc ribbon domain-containing protein [Phycisphaerae bacterium]|nr:zinc ribbon domain-containing protein [Phycisphaerae bacterium]